MKKFNAFTLAEILITLGVIGVVAAMTMPILIKKYNEHVTVTKVKKWYSMMNQAVLMSVSENGYPNEWNVSSGNFEQSNLELATYIKPYLKIINDCGIEKESSCFIYNNTNPMYKLNSNLVSEDYSNYYKINLADGSFIWFRSSTASNKYCSETRAGIEGKICGVFYFDINGEKKPNTIGRDIFAVFLTSNGMLRTDTLSEQCNIKKSNYKGWGCITNILKNGNMNYLKK